LPGCSQRDAPIAHLQARVAALEQQLAELGARLGSNASSSSLPRSAKLPRAAKPVVLRRSRRRRGAQRGHPPALRLRLLRNHPQATSNPTETPWVSASAHFRSHTHANGAYRA
jgi:hypothetical protein